MSVRNGVYESVVFVFAWGLAADTLLRGLPGLNTLHVEVAATAHLILFSMATALLGYWLQHRYALPRPAALSSFALGVAMTFLFRELRNAIEGVESVESSLFIATLALANWILLLIGSSLAYLLKAKSSKR